MPRQPIQTDRAPRAIGAYSQAVRAGNTVYLSGQIPLDPDGMDVVTGDFSERCRQVFRNLEAVCKAAGGSFDDVVKLNVFLTDLGNFAAVNTVLDEFFEAPYPARAAVQVAALPKAVDVEIDGVMQLPD